MGTGRGSGGVRVVLTHGSSGRGGRAPLSPRRTPRSGGPVVRLLRRGLSPAQIVIVVMALALLGAGVLRLAKGVSAETHRRKVSERYQQRVNQGLIDPAYDSE